MTEQLRRVVTGHNDSGESVVIVDSGPASEVAANGSGLYEIWQTESVPADNARFDDQLLGVPPTLCPPSGAVKVRWFSVPPENDAGPAADREAAAAFSFEAVGASAARVDTRRHPTMHRTQSVDYIVVIRGKLDMLLDAGEVRALKPGDVVIQRGTNHAWVNRGSEPALLVAVLADAGS